MADLTKNKANPKEKNDTEYGETARDGDTKYHT